MDSFSNGFFENDNVTCMSPWYELRINSNGEYTYCHASNDNEKSTMLPSDWFNNGSAVNQARKQMKHGHSVSGCRECYQTEQAKLLSHRNRRNLQAAIYPNDFFKQSLHSSPAWNRMNGKTQHTYSHRHHNIRQLLAASPYRHLNNCTRCRMRVHIYHLLPRPQQNERKM